MKLAYLPHLAVNNIGFLQHLLFGLVPVYVSVKKLYFYQVLEQKNTKTWNVAGLSESVKVPSPAACVFYRFPKISQHPACMDHAILHGKQFSNPLMSNDQ